MEPETKGKNPNICHSLLYGVGFIVLFTVGIKPFSQEEAQL